MGYTPFKYAAKMIYQQAAKKNLAKLIDQWRDYCQECKTYRKGAIFKVNRMQYGAITRDMNNGLLQLLYHGHEVKMPSGLGTLQVMKSKQVPYTDPITGKLVKKKLAVDWKSTRDMWKEMYPNVTTKELIEIRNKPKIYFTHEEDGLYRKGLQWFNQCVIRNIKHYKFSLGEYEKKGLGKFINEHSEVDYKVKERSNVFFVK